MKRIAIPAGTFRPFALFALSAAMAAGIAAAPLLEASIPAQKSKEPLVVPKFDTAPKIDGVLDDAVWEKFVRFWFLGALSESAFSLRFSPPTIVGKHR